MPQIHHLRFLDVSEMHRHSSAGPWQGRLTTFHTGLVAEDQWVAALRPGLAAGPAASVEAVAAAAIIGRCKAKVLGTAWTSGVAVLAAEAPGDPGCHMEVAVDVVAADSVVHKMQGHGTSREDLSRNWRLLLRMVALTNALLMP